MKLSSPILCAATALCLATPSAAQEAVSTPVTFTPLAWGMPPDKTASQLGTLQRGFGVWFPRGVVLGDAAGANGDDRFSIVVANQREAVALLRRPGGSPGSLRFDTRGHQKHSGGVLAKQLLALKLNIALDNNRGGELARWVLAPNAPKVLRGRTVAEVTRIADKALAGEYGVVDGGSAGRKTIDVDADGRPDLSFSELADVLLAINRSGSPFDHTASLVKAPPAEPTRVGPPTGGPPPPSGVIGDREVTETGTPPRPRPQRTGDAKEPEKVPEPKPAESGAKKDETADASKKGPTRPWRVGGVRRSKQPAEAEPGRPRGNPNADPNAARRAEYGAAVERAKATLAAHIQRLEEAYADDPETLAAEKEKATQAYRARLAALAKEYGDAAATERTNAENRARRREFAGKLAAMREELRTELAALETTKEADPEGYAAKREAITAAYRERMANLAEQYSDVSGASGEGEADDAKKESQGKEGVDPEVRKAKDAEKAGEKTGEAKGEGGGTEG